MENKPKFVNAKDRLCFALDVSNFHEAAHFVDLLEHEVGLFKIGLELFVVEGPRIVQKVCGSNARSFLDLKLHDIPETIARTMRVISGYGVDYTTVHASGGVEMLAAAMETCGETKVLAVTVLTSIDEEQCRNIYGTTPRTTVRSFVADAVNIGVDGFVCSAKEVRDTHTLFPSSIYVVPGIRPAGTDAHDQARVATPAASIQAGADILVVGRPIRDAKDPVEAARAIVEEMESATVFRQE